MAGLTDPREDQVEPITPDFSVPEDSGEIEATYLVTVLLLLEAFYTEFSGQDPEYVLDNVDQRGEQLYNDLVATISSLIPAIALLGVAEAIKDILKAIDLGGDTALLSMELEKISTPDIQYPLEEQKATAKAIVDEIKNDLKNSAIFIKNRLEREPGSTIKYGNIIHRAVTRSKSMVIHGAMTAFNNSKLELFDKVFEKETLYNWITRDDDKVCGFCRFFEAEGPYTIELLPPCPYHLWCRCTVRPVKFKFREWILEIYEVIKNGR